MNMAPDMILGIQKHFIWSDRTNHLFAFWFWKLLAKISFFFHEFQQTAPVRGYSNH